MLDLSARMQTLSQDRSRALYVSSWCHLAVGVILEMINIRRLSYTYNGVRAREVVEQLWHFMIWCKYRHGGCHGLRKEVLVRKSVYYLEIYSLLSFCSKFKRVSMGFLRYGPRMEYGHVARSHVVV
jgi:hypothetical protein